MISSSLNSVHDSNTGNGRGKPSFRIVQPELYLFLVKGISDGNRKARGRDAVPALCRELLYRFRLAEIDGELGTIACPLDTIVICKRPPTHLPLDHPRRTAPRG